MEELDGIAVRREYREEPTEEEEHEYREATVGEAAGRSQEPRARAEKSGHAAKGVASPEIGEKKGSATCVSAGCAVMVQVSFFFFHPSVVLCFVLYAFGFMQFEGILSIRRRGAALLSPPLLSPLSCLFPLLSSSLLSP